MKVFAYPRVSTDEQVDKGNSLTEQQERLIAYCVAMGWEQPTFFIEEGYSAKNTNRPRLRELLEQVKLQPGGIVITTKLDRLSRKLSDILSLNDYFNKYNFQYVSATEGFDTSTPAGRLVLQMLGMVAEFERERISERVRDNMLSLAKNGDKVISRPCFGYDVIDGQKLINIEEYLAVRHMVSWALAGEGSRSIAKKMNTVVKMSTKDGNEWGDKAVRELLQRETLIGHSVHNKTSKVDNIVIKNDEALWIRKENTHDPILSQDEHDKIVELFQGRKRVGRHFSNETYLLSGLVICKHCNSKMNGKMNRNFSKRLGRENLHYQYLCDGYLKKAKCYHHFVKRDEIESIIINRIKEVSVSAAGQLKLIISKKDEVKIDIDAIKSKLIKLDKKMQKRIDAYDDDLITAYDLKLATKQINEERDVLKKMLHETEEQKYVKQSSSIKARATLLLKDITSQDRLKSKQAIYQLIDKIEILNGSDINITWHG